jgi:anti-sigma regulatory factor (Ser/Thr protein kinase)
LVSELLTDALKASWLSDGSGFIALRLLPDQERLIIEVRDQNPTDPRPRRADGESENGRGSTVIEAISGRWGFKRFSSSRKVAWCELGIQPR